LLPFSVPSLIQNPSPQTVLAKNPDANELEPFLDKDYRDSYLEGFVKGSIALQIRALREKFGLSQVDFAKKMGMTQSVVSRLEDAEYGGVSVNTLLKVAKENGVALNIGFSDYLSVVHADLKPSIVDDIFETIQKIEQYNSSAVSETSVYSDNSTVIFILINNDVPVARTYDNNNTGVLTWQNLRPLQQTLEHFNPVNSPAFETLTIGKFTQT
jgi:transcriptional regulator with XRE-family HTH domain